MYITAYTHAAPLHIFIAHARRLKFRALQRRRRRWLSIKPLYTARVSSPRGTTTTRAADMGAAASHNEVSYMHARAGFKQKRPEERERESARTRDEQKAVWSSGVEESAAGCCCFLSCCANEGIGLLLGEWPKDSRRFNVFLPDNC